MDKKDVVKLIGCLILIAFFMFGIKSIGSMKYKSGYIEGIKVGAIIGIKTIVNVQENCDYPYSKKCIEKYLDENLRNSQLITKP